MSSIPECVEGRRVSCAIMQVVKDMQAPPNWFEFFSLFVIPLFAAVASAAAAGAAVWVATQSRKDRDKERFEHAVGAMLGAVGAFVGELRVYGKERGLWLNRWARGTETGQQGPIPPDDTVVIASVLTARLSTRDKGQQNMLDEVRSVVDGHAEEEHKIRLEALTEIMSLVVDWMSVGSSEQDKILGKMKALEPKGKDTQT